MKSKFIKSTIILTIGGGITKLLAMIIKIFLTRSIGSEGIGLYMLILPTFNLFITLSTLSLSTSISKLVSESNSSKNIILPVIPISLLYNFILMIGLIITAPFIANNLLNNNEAYYPIMAISFTLPFICLSNILKGYFYGRENMLPYVIANNLEQIVRLVFIIAFIPKILIKGRNFAVTGVVLINIISELISSICLILFIPNKKISIRDFKFDKYIFKDILDISLNTTGSRIIGSISYFLEPIILTYSLSRIGFNNDYIMTNYGIISGYVYPLLLIPSFFTMAISTSLLPVISNSYSKGNFKYAKNKLRQAIYISLSIGLFFTILCLMFSKEILNIVFATSNGLEYIKIIAPFFLVHYIQGPLTAYLQATNMSKNAMIDTLLGSIIKNILLLILPTFMGIWGFISASIINIFYVTLSHIYHIIKN